MDGLGLSQLLICLRKGCLRGRAWKEADKSTIIILVVDCPSLKVRYKKEEGRLRVEFERGGLRSQ